MPYSDLLSHSSLNFCLSVLLSPAFHLSDVRCVQNVLPRPRQPDEAIGGKTSDSCDAGRMPDD
jgi:hypothetical protein